jgi:hypothetical protein
MGVDIVLHTNSFEFVFNDLAEATGKQASRWRIDGFYAVSMLTSGAVAVYAQNGSEFLLSVAQQPIVGSLLVSTFDGQTPASAQDLYSMISRYLG